LEETLMPLAQEDLAGFTAHVRKAMFDGARTHRWPDNFTNLWPNITPEYRFQHTLHVLKFVEMLQREDGGDLEVLQTSAIFHDVSHFSCHYDVHGRVSAEMARTYLVERGLDSTFVDRVYQTIDDHASDKPPSYYLTDAPVESIILIEADLADKLGPNGVVTHLLLSGYNRRLWQATNEALERFVIGRGERALSSGKIRWTPAGRRLIEERLAWVRRFLGEIREDIACVF